MGREDHTEDDSYGDDEDKGAGPLHSVTESETDESGTNHEAQQLDGHEFDTAGATTVPKGNDFGTATAMTHQYPKAGSTGTDGDEGCDNVRPWLWQQGGNKGLAEVEHQTDEDGADDALDEDDGGHMLQMGTPETDLFLRFRLFLIRRVAFQLLFPTLRNDVLHQTVGR